MDGELVRVSLREGCIAEIIRWEDGFKVRIISYMTDEELRNEWVSKDGLVSFLLECEGY